MVGENFEFLMSKMPKNAVNYQKLDCTPGRNRKIQIPHQNHFSPGTLKSDFSIQTEPFGKSWYLPKILGRNDTMPPTNTPLNFWMQSSQTRPHLIVMETYDDLVKGLKDSDCFSLSLPLWRHHVIYDVTKTHINWRSELDGCLLRFSDIHKGQISHERYCSSDHTGWTLFSLW